MNHNEAVEQMAAEQYLLDELTPDLRDAFEAHVFECQECALDLRAGKAFLDEAKAQLPELTRDLKWKARPRDERRDWFAWLRPAFAAPVMAALLIVVGYQNFVTIPGMRSAASQPQLLPWASVHVGTRSPTPVPVAADSKSGVTMLVDLPQLGTYPTYVVELFDSNGKSVWKGTIASPGESGNGAVSLVIRRQGLRQGAYTLVVSGVLPSGQMAEVGRRAVEVSFGN
jgi:hypothetical protein